MKAKDRSIAPCERRSFKVQNNVSLPLVGDGSLTTVGDKPRRYKSVGSVAPYGRR